MCKGKRDSSLILVAYPRFVAIAVVHLEWRTKIRNASTSLINKTKRYANDLDEAPNMKSF